jgi:signal transduction histidine kinase
VYRVISEALANAARHAGPGVRRVLVENTVSGCRVTVIDDGRGFDGHPTGNGLGLRGMRERAEMLGGSVTLQSSKGNGTTIVLELPAETP